jgi:hypothetical protein
VQLEHVLAAAEVDGANDVGPAVQAELLTDTRKVIEREASRRDELVLLVGLVDAGHLFATHQRPRSLTRAPQRSQRWKRSVKKKGRLRRGSL